MNYINDIGKDNIKTLEGRISMIKDVSRYLCSREECLKDIDESIKSCSRKDLISRMSHSECLKLDKNIRNSFFACNYDARGNVFLFDEISPKLVAKYIIDNLALEVEDELIYAYVCRVQMKIINAFYKEIAKGQISWQCATNVISKQIYEDKYYKLVQDRLKYPIKRLRGI